MRNICAAIALVCLLAACGCKVTKPSTVESKTMDTLKRNLTVGGKDWKNPIAYTPEAAKKEESTFSITVASAMDWMARIQACPSHKRWSLP